MAHLSSPNANQQPSGDIGGDCGFLARIFDVSASLLIKKTNQVVISFGEGDRFSGVATASTPDLANTPMQPLIPA